jgi:hypothetical protein
MQSRVDSVASSPSARSRLVSRRRHGEAQSERLADPCQPIRANFAGGAAFLAPGTSQITDCQGFSRLADNQREAGLQLLDALERLETVERRFQERSRISQNPRRAAAALASENGKGKGKEIFS